MKIKSSLKFFIYKTLYACKIQSLLLKKIQQQHFLPILSLHHVSPVSNPFWPSLHPVIFDQLLGYLNKHFSIVLFHELEHPTPKPKLILSFDDGYYDFIEYAMPILKKHGLRANQNIIPSQVLAEKPLWNIALYDFLNAAPASLIQKIHFPGFDAKQHQTLDKTQLGLKLSRALKNRPHTEREVIFNALEQNIFSQVKDYPRTRMINFQEIHQILAEQHEIGAHSYSHHSMEFESMEDFIQDFEQCRQFFKKQGLPELNTYAFPNGSYRSEQIDYLKANNIKYILLVEDHYAQRFNATYYRFNIAATTYEEAVFQALGIKHYLESKKKA